MPTLAQRLQAEFQRRRLTYRRDRIPGGLGDKATASDFDREQVAKGLKVEMEHTSDPRVALEIALDHLSENPRYYDELAKLKLSRMLSAEFSRLRYAKFVESEHPRDEGGKFIPSGMNKHEEELWTKATASIPSHVLDAANIKKFRIGKTEGPSTGGYTFEGIISVDGSNPQTALHEVSHNIENAYDRELATIRVKLRDDPRVRGFGARERTSVVIEAFFSAKDSRPRRWLDEVLPDIRDELSRVFRDDPNNN